MTPILISLFRIEPHIAIGTDLLYAAISKFCGSLVHARKLNIVWPIVLWLALGSIPASFATHWVLEHYLSQSTHYKAVLTTVLGFMLTLTGISIIFRAQIEKFLAVFVNLKFLIRNKRCLLIRAAASIFYLWVSYWVYLLPSLR